MTVRVAPSAQHRAGKSLRAHVCCLIVLAFLASAARAAAVDLSGEYVVAYPLTCRFIFTQSGNALEVGGSCGPNALNLTGTANPTTGGFMVSGNLGAYCSTLAITGSGDGDPAVQGGGGGRQLTPRVARPGVRDSASAQRVVRVGPAPLRSPPPSAPPASPQTP